MSHTQSSTLGLDIGGSSIKIALVVPGRAAILEQSTQYHSPDGAEFEQIVRELIHQPAMRETVLAHPPGAVGVCLPGVWNGAVGALERSNNLPRLVGVRLEEMLCRAMGMSLPRWTISTDVHATAVDVWHGLAPSVPRNEDQRPRRLFCLALGTGVGACVLDEGELLRINGNSSGHFGQIDVTVPGDTSPPVASDGGVGTLEAYWAATHVKVLLGIGRNSGISGGFPLSLIDSMARALRIAHAIYRPDVIVLAGGTALHLGPQLGEITRAVQRGLSSIARTHCEIRLATHAHHAALGIARLASQITPSVR